MKSKSQKNKIGFAVTGSFCTHGKIKKIISSLHEEGYEIFPIVSFNTATMDSRFGNSSDFLNEIEEITGKKNIKTIQNAETIGPGNFLDALVIAPCTGNTLAKLANGITDSPVLMAAKAHLRNEKPLIIAVSTNDAMGLNFQNIGKLYNVKNIYFVPFFQDNPEKKPCSLIAKFDLIDKTIEAALKGGQLQPVLYEK